MIEGKLIRGSAFRRNVLFGKVRDGVEGSFKEMKDIFGREVLGKSGKSVAKDVFEVGEKSSDFLLVKKGLRIGRFKALVADSLKDKIKVRVG